jgi:hypothetical protein
MKTRIATLVVFALGILTIGVFAVRAQITTQLTFKMSQPFTVGNTTLPAGSYVVTPVPETEQSIIQIAAASGKPSVLADVNFVSPDASQPGSHLVFNKYKNVVALSQIFPGGGNQGYELLQGHPEKLAAKTETPTKQTVASSAK